MTDKAVEEASHTATALLAIVRQLAFEVRPGRGGIASVTLDSLLDRDLGLDSLARMELLARIERSFHVTVSERELAEAETPRDVLRALLSAGPSGGLAPGLEIGISDSSVTEGAPQGARTLVEVLQWHAQHHPDRAHIQFYRDGGGGGSLTYGRLQEKAGAVAGVLQKEGLGVGEPVAIMLPTSMEYFCTFFGVLLAGGIPVPLYPPARRAQMEDHLHRHRSILNNCRASTLITVPEVKRLALLLKPHVRSLRSVVTVEELPSDPGMIHEPAIGSENVALLQYTSGSTGTPKGVVLTHGNLLANIRAMGQAADAGSRDVFVSWLPLYHDMGLIGAWLGSLCYGALLVILSPLDFIARPHRWLRAIHGWRGTVSAAPNFAYELCVKKIRDEDIEGLDLSSWRAAVNGAEPVGPGTMERFWERFGRYGLRKEALMPVYGLAESSVGLAFPPLGRGPLIDAVQRDTFMKEGKAIPSENTDPRALRFACCGRPLPGHEIRIVDSSDRELPERREGRLQFRGPSSCSGYYRSPEETRRLFHGPWLDSGDRAYFAEGEVFITGRTKDIIIRAGRNVYPHELEDAIGDIPGIRKGCVAVFASSDPELGTERMVVLAEAREEEPGRVEELRTSIAALSSDLVGMPPEDIVLTPPQTLLKTSSGKIRRAANRELYEQGRLGRGPEAPWRQAARMILGGIGPTVRGGLRSLSERLYGLYAWSVLVFSAPFLWMAVVLLPHFSWRCSLLQTASRCMARAVGIPLRVHGTENLALGRPCVLVANHASYIDSYLLPGCLPGPWSFVAKSELARSFALRIFLRRIRTELVERFDPRKGVEDARRMVGLAREGRSLLFFPEGTFRRMPGLLPFHMGAFLTAVEAGLPVVPVAVRGTRSILRDGTWLPRRGAVVVTIGKPIELDSASLGKDADSWGAALRLCQASREHILSHIGEPDLGHEPSPHW